MARCMNCSVAVDDLGIVVMQGGTSIAAVCWGCLTQVRKARVTLTRNFPGTRFEEEQFDCVEAFPETRV